jgi:hypothetical protein
MDAEGAHLSLHDFINNFAAKYPLLASIGVQRMEFATPPYDPSKLVIEQFFNNRSFPFPFQKTLLLPEHTEFVTIHHAYLKEYYSKITVNMSDQAHLAHFMNLYSIRIIAQGEITGNATEMLWAVEHVRKQTMYKMAWLQTGDVDMLMLKNS